MKTSTEINGDATCILFHFERELDRSEVEAMAGIVESAMAASDDLRLVLDLSATREYDASAFISFQGALTSFKSIAPVKRYAVVGAPGVVDGAIKLFGSLLPLEARTFDTSELLAAREWAFASPTE